MGISRGAFYIVFLLMKKDIESILNVFFVINCCLFSGFSRKCAYYSPALL